MFVSLMARPFAFVGVVHLPPLPGAPRPGPGLAGVMERALADAGALAEGGAHGLIIENLGDAPFSKGAVEPHVVAILARIAAEVRRRWPELVVGVNALRNDAVGALSAAVAGDAAFIRVNVLVGAMVTDQGIIEGNARELGLLRRRLEAPVGVVADVMVKHAAPLASMDLGQLAHDTLERAGADVLVVTGSGTGRPADLDRLRAVAAVGPTWVGSGVDLERAEIVRGLARGAIVGTALHQDGRLDLPIDPARVREMARALG